MSSTPATVASGSLTADDFCRGWLLELRPRPSLAVAGGVLAIASVVALTVLLVALSLGQLPFSTVLPFIMSLFYVPLLLYSRRREAIQFFRLSPYASHSITATASDAGLTVMCGGITYAVAWEQITGCRENSTHLLITSRSDLLPRYGLPIPKRFFLPPSQASVFRAGVEDRIRIAA